MQPDARIVRNGDETEHVAHPLRCQEAQKRGAERATEPCTPKGGVKVYGQLGVPCIGRSLPDAVGVRVSRYRFVAHRDDEGVGVSETGEPRTEIIKRRYACLERDSGFVYVGCVNLENGGEIAGPAKSQRYLGLFCHGIRLSR